jgi:hypothetical protein
VIQSEMTPVTNRPGGARETAFASAVLLALTFAFFAPVLRGAPFSTVPMQQKAQFPWRGVLGGGPLVGFPQTDEAELSFPWQSFLTDSLEDGSIPFWNPNSFAGGYPHYGNGSSAILYPPRLIAALTLSPTNAHIAFSMLHVFLAGFFMYLLLKEFGAGLGGALLGAVSWMLGSFTLGYIHLEVMATMSTFIPLVLLTVRRAWRSRRRTDLVVAGLSLGLALMSGHVLLLGVVWLVGVAYAFALALSRVIATSGGRRTAALSEAGRLAGMVAISLGIAAVVLAPTVQVLADSARDPIPFEAFKRGALVAPSTFLHTAVPPDAVPSHTLLHKMAFVGTVTAAFAVLGVFLRRRSGAWLGRVLLAGSFAVAVGGPVTWIAYHFLPGFNVIRPYSRLLSLWTFGVALLGGLGFDATLRWMRARLKIDHEQRLAAALARRGALALAAAVAILFTAAQLGEYGRAINPPFFDDVKLFPSTPLVSALKKEVQPEGGGWPGRILPVRIVTADGAEGRHILYAAQSLVYGVDSAGGYDSTMPRRVSVLIRILEGANPLQVASSGLNNAYKPSFLSDRARLDLAEQLGITTIIAQPSTGKAETWQSDLATQLVYEGPDGRILRLVGAPRGPLLVYREELVSNELDALRRFVDPSFDVRSAVILEREDLAREGVRPAGSAVGTGRILAATRGVNTARISVESTTPAWLVVTDSYSPGWSATVNGRPTPVVRADYAKRAIQVPAGRSEVAMRYLPPGLKAGVAVTSLTAIVVLVIIVGPPIALRMKRRRESSIL